MEYIYAALLLYKAGKQVNESAVQAVLSAAGIAVNEARVKALISALDGVDIEEAISKAAAAPVALAAAPTAAAPADTVEEAPPEVDKKAEEESGMAGLGALFG